MAEGMIRNWTHVEDQKGMTANTLVYIYTYTCMCNHGRSSRHNDVLCVYRTKSGHEMNIPSSGTQLWTVAVYGTDEIYLYSCVFMVNQMDGPRRLTRSRYLYIYL